MGIFDFFKKKKNDVYLNENRPTHIVKNRRKRINEANKNPKMREMVNQVDEFVKYKAVGDSLRYSYAVLCMLDDLDDYSINVEFPEHDKLGKVYSYMIQEWGNEGYLIQYTKVGFYCWIEYITNEIENEQKELPEAFLQLILFISDGSDYLTPKVAEIISKYPNEPIFTEEDYLHLDSVIMQLLYIASLTIVEAVEKYDFQMDSAYFELVLQFSKNDYFKGISRDAVLSKAKFLSQHMIEELK